MLKAGDHVRVNATEEIGTVRHVHPHEVLVAVQVGNDVEERRFPYESLRLEPTMHEATGFIDH